MPKREQINRCLGILLPDGTPVSVLLYPHCRTVQRKHIHFKRQGIVFEMFSDDEDSRPWAAADLGTVALEVIRA